MVAIRQDFLRLLREDDEFRAEIRREVLTAEVLNLPDMFARMTVRQDGMSEQLAQITTRQDKLTEQLAHLTIRVDKLAEQVVHLTIRVDNLTEQVDRLTIRVDNLAEQLARLTIRVDNLAEQVADLTVRVGEMAVHMGEMASDMSSMDGRLKRVENDVAVLKGEVIELKMANKVVPVVSYKLKLRSGRIVWGGQPTDASIAFVALIYDAYESGAIDERECNRIIATDMIISAVSKESGTRAYVAVEASFVVDIRDVTRAQDSAEILAKVFPNTKTYSAVYGRNVNPIGRAEADRRGVFVYDSA